MKPPGMWYDGFDGKSPVLLDEIDKQQLKLGDLLRLADRYDLQVPSKGAHVRFNAGRIFATSNLPIEEWFPHLTETELAALVRRIDTHTTFRWVQDGNVRRVKVNHAVYGIPLPDNYDPAANDSEDHNLFLLGLGDAENTSPLTPPATQTTKKTTKVVKANNPRKTKRARVM